MAKSHFEYIMAALPHCAVPGKADVLALPEQATFFYPGAVFDDNVPGGLGAERPAMRHEGDFYTYVDNGGVACYFKLALNEPAPSLRYLPDAEALKWAFGEAEAHDLDVTCVGSCLHYLAENTFGFNTTHPDYTEEIWLKPIEARAKGYHGDDAFRTLETACDMIGMEGYEGYFPDDFVVPLLQAAQVQSEYHRHVR